VGDDVPGGQELDVCGYRRPSPMARLFGGACPRCGPAERPFEELDEVLDVKGAAACAPEEVRVWLTIPVAPERLRLAAPLTARHPSLLHQHERAL
jgi:hypothetical protein